MQGSLRRARKNPFAELPPSPRAWHTNPRGNLKSTARPTAPKFARSRSKRAASARHQRPCRRDRKRHGGRNDAYFAIPLVPCCCISHIGVRPSPRSKKPMPVGHKEGPGLPKDGALG